MAESDWVGTGQADTWSRTWGGRTWKLVASGNLPGLFCQTGSTRVGPLLAIEGVAATGLGLSRFVGWNSSGSRADGPTIDWQTSADSGDWQNLAVHASWRVVDEVIELEVVAELQAHAREALRGFEVRVVSTLPEPSGSRRRRWVEPRDAEAAARGYDGREGDVGDLTTLPPSGASGLAPRVIPSPWDDGTSYVELCRPAQVARRVSEAYKVSSVGHTTRYALFGENLPPGGRFLTRLRGLWLLSASVQRDALDRAAAFEAEG